MKKTKNIARRSSDSSLADHPPQQAAALAVLCAPYARAAAGNSMLIEPYATAAVRPQLALCPADSDAALALFAAPWAGGGGAAAAAGSPYVTGAAAAVPPSAVAQQQPTAALFRQAATPIHSLRSAALLQQQLQLMKMDLSSQTPIVSSRSCVQWREGILEMVGRNRWGFYCFFFVRENCVF